MTHHEDAEAALRHVLADVSRDNPRPSAADILAGLSTYGYRLVPEVGDPRANPLYPEGRTLYYGDDDPDGFAATVKAEFGFDPSQDEDWAVWIDHSDDSPDGSPGFTSYGFHCPSEHLDAIRDRWLLGS